MRTYFKFLSRNKLYTFVTVFGFSVSLMFVIILGIYVRNEMSVDRFHSKADRIYMLCSEQGANWSNLAPPYIQSILPDIESYSRVANMDVYVRMPSGERLKTPILLADSTFFTLFDFRLTNGIPSQVLNDRKSAVISQDFARKLFADKDPVGQSVFLYNFPCTITGVMEGIPSNSQFKKVDIVVNYHFLSDLSGENAFRWGNCSFMAYYLLKAGTDLESKARILEETFKKEAFMWLYHQGFHKEVHFVSLPDCYFDSRVVEANLENRANNMTKVKVLTGIVLLILVIAVLNYVNMTVAQAGFRGKESAIRRLLGGSRSGVIRKLLLESLVMTLLTFVTGLLLAFAFEPFFNRVLETTLDLKHQFTPSTVIAIALFVVLLSFLSGILPAWIISRFKPIEVVKGTLRYRIKSTYSKVLIIFQYTIAVALLVCSLFMIRQTHYLIHSDLGFRTRGVLWMSNTADSVPKGMLRAELEKIPGVEKVSYACGNPIRYVNNMSFTKNGVNVSTWEMVVDSVFFDFFEISPIPLTDEPVETFFDREKMRAARIIPEWGNMKMINAVQPDPETGIFTQGDDDNDEVKYRMVGRIPDLKYKPLNMEQSPLQIRPLYAREQPWVTLVRASDEADKSAVLAAVSDTYKRVTGAEDIEPLWAEDIILDRYKSQTNLSQLISAFALLTVLIMVMGVFAMSLYMIKQKEKEIALRKVNGATVATILAMLNIQSLRRFGIALLIALPVSWWAMDRWLQTFAFHIRLDWWVFVVAALIVLLLSLVSTSLQSWRAACANPVDYLKNE